MDQARGSLEDLNLTKEEVDKFQNAFKDEAFKKMFAEYAAEIADPKNKAESDAYLRQLEMEGKIESVYGKDVQLVMPKAGFVAKTFDEGPADDGPSTSSPDDRGSGASSSDARKTGRKAFVNVCRSDKCEDATSEKRPGGLQWSVPHTLGQPHEEKDKAGETCVAYDFCVSEHTYELTRRDERLKKMVVETAIEAVNRAFGTRLSLDFTTPKKTFVGPKTGPGVQAIKGGGKAPSSTGKATSAGAPGGRVAPSRGPGAETKASAFRFGDAVAGEKRPARAGPEPEPAGECEPKHTIVHREDGKDMSKQFGTGSASREAEKRRDTRPSALVLRVHLPKLDSVAAAELDVGDSRVFFRVPGKYKLDLALPYEVFGDEGRAKFDKAARKLEVTLPVRPAPRAPAPAFTEPVETIADSAEARDEAVPSDAVAPAAAPDDAEARAAASAAAAVAAAAAFDAQGETENQRRWREAHDAREKEAREKEADEARASSASNAAATNGDEREDDDATPFSVGDEKASSSEIGAAKTAAAATFLRPSLRGAAELGDELD